MVKDVWKTALVMLLCGVLIFGCGARDTKETAMEQSGAEKGRAGQELENERTTGAQAETLHFIDAWGEWHDMTVDPNVEKHAYDWSCLTNTEEGVNYDGDSRYAIRRGVDVSEHQGTVDWGQVKAAGYEFVFLRIGYRGYGDEGNLCVDARFHENIAGAKAAGLDVGVYIFSQAVNEEETLEEAELVLENLEGYDLELPVVFDPERIRDDEARTDEVSGEQFTRNTVLFCEKMKAAGYQPMVYSNLIWEAYEFDMKELAEYLIWYADYEPAPQTPYRFTFWQYSEKGHVDGIEGGVDLNVQFIEKENHNEP